VTFYTDQSLVLKFKTCKTCVLNFRTICLNICKSDKAVVIFLVNWWQKICWSDKEQPVCHPFVSNRNHFTPNNFWAAHDKVLQMCELSVLNIASLQNLSSSFQTLVGLYMTTTQPYRTIYPLDPVKTMI
jgi:hypothetical protein